MECERCGAVLDLDDNPESVEPICETCAYEERREDGEARFRSESEMDYYSGNE